jgi:hypothetical protein
MGYRRGVEKKDPAPKRIIFYRGEYTAFNYSRDAVLIVIQQMVFPKASSQKFAMTVRTFCFTTFYLH